MIESIEFECETSAVDTISFARMGDGSVMISAKECSDKEIQNVLIFISKADVKKLIEFLAEVKTGVAKNE